jgi:hypothetical protein
MADEFGTALRASCAFVSHITLADRVLPHIEDWLPATRTRKVCRHSDTGTQGMYPAATQSRAKRPKPALVAPRRSVRRTRNVARVADSDGRISGARSGAVQPRQRPTALRSSTARSRRDSQALARDDPGRGIGLARGRLWVCVHIGARHRSTVGVELALRPGFLSPSPEVHRRRYLRHEAWGGGYWF